MVTFVGVSFRGLVCIAAVNAVASSSQGCSGHVSADTCRGQRYADGEAGMCVQIHAESRVQQQVYKCRCLQRSELGIGNASAVACRG